MDLTLFSFLSFFHFPFILDLGEGMWCDVIYMLQSCDTGKVVKDSRIDDII